MKTSKRAFTLIELLVVIAIMGILAVGSIGVYTSYFGKARDTTRVSDLGVVQNAVEGYYLDKHQYIGTGTTEWTGATMLATLPQGAVDPATGIISCLGNGAKQPCDYYYAVGEYSGFPNGQYEISAALENQANYDDKAGSTADKGNDDTRYEVWGGGTGGVLDTDTAHSGSNLILRRW